jgi:hypothetical protein
VFGKFSTGWADEEWQRSYLITDLCKELQSTSILNGYGLDWAVGHCPKGLKAILIGCPWVPLDPRR